MALRADCGVRPAVVPESAADFPAQLMDRLRDMRIPEDLDLSVVEPGDYELIALSIKLEGLDAAPVRAVLSQQ